MTKKLSDYFPMIRTRKEVLDEITHKESLQELFDSWREEQQEEFLDFCTGIRGVKVLRNGFSREIMNPEYHKERMERFLSLILKKQVKIVQVLPNDSVRLADENSLLITDIIVELDDGSLANIEIQRIGYAFPGERMACYQADMLLRQYKRVKERRKNKFTYRDIKNVYMIIFFEKSTKEFHDQKEEYIHYGKTTFDSGLQLKTPQNYILIPLDIFKEKTQNKAIESELEAWLTFLGSDEPERIAELLERYPDFRVMYEEIYQICSNIEGVMSMFSEELRELDRNTVQYMIEEQEKILKRQEKELKEQEKELKEQEKALKEQSVLLEDKDAEIAALRRELEAVSNKKGTASSSK